MGRRRWSLLPERLEFKPLSLRQTKQCSNEIDRVLAKHYIFTDEELDLIIINYDIKYRLGQDMESDSYT